MGRRVEDFETRFKKHFTPNIETGCWEWTGTKNKTGYGLFWVNESKNPCRLAHRIAWKLWRGEPNGCVLHAPLICNNRVCVNPDHLRIGTHQDNANDRVIDGNSNKGSKHPNSKLTEEQVQTIRTSTKSGKELAIEFKVSQATISMIRLGKRR